MIDGVIADLEADGLLPVGVNWEKTIRLTRGESVSILLSRRRKPVLHLKLSECTERLQDEARRHELAQAHFSPWMPNLQGFGRSSDRVAWIATKGFAFVSLEGAFKMGVSPLVLEATSALLSVQSCAPSSVKADVTNPSLVSMLRTAAVSWGKNAFLTQFLDDATEELVASLVPRPQHGDFWAGNMALEDTRRLIVFDWEDYGRLELPGMDLYTLLATSSFAERDTLSVIPPHLIQLRTSVLAALDIEEAVFERLLPVYALAFRWLKETYSAEVRQRLDETPTLSPIHRARQRT